MNTVGLLLMSQNNSTLEKLILLVIVALFAGVVYAILPRLTEKKIRGLHKQIDIEEEEAEELAEKMNDDGNQGVEK